MYVIVSVYPIPTNSFSAAHFIYNNYRQAVSIIAKYTPTVEAYKLANNLDDKTKKKLAKEKLASAFTRAGRHRGHGNQDLRHNNTPFPRGRHRTLRQAGSLPGRGARALAPGAVERRLVATAVWAGECFGRGFGGKRFALYGRTPAVR